MAHRVTVTLEDDDFERLKYWAAKNDMSINEYLREAYLTKIRMENEDYDLPTLEARRLNQIIDALTVLSHNTQSLESVVVNGFDSLIGLTKGDNYLFEREDGEI